MAVALLVGVYVARYLGPGQFGELSYAASFAGLFSAFAMLGLDGIVVRELVRDESRRDELLGTAFWLKLAGAVLTLFFLAITLNFIGGTTEEKFLILIIATGFLFQSASVIDFYFQANVQSKFVVHAQIAQVAISAILKIVLVLIKAPLLWFAFVMLADCITLSIFLIITYTRRKNLSMKTWNFQLETAKSLLRDSWPMILSGIAVSLYMKIDQVMIRNMLDAKAVGNYAAAVRISEAFFIFPVLVASSIFPSIIKSKNNNRKEYLKKIQHLYDIMVIFGLSISIPVFLFAKKIIIFTFGSNYQNAKDVLAINTWSIIFVGLGVISGRYIIAENITITNLYRTSTGAILNIFANYFLIKYHGINGASFATLISYIFTYLIYDFFDNKLREQGKQKLQSITLYSSLKFICSSK